MQSDFNAIFMSVPDQHRVLAVTVQLMEVGIVIEGEWLLLLSLTLLPNSLGTFKSGIYF